MEKLNIQFGEISFSCPYEKASVLHAPIVAPTYRNPLKKLVSDVSSPAPVSRKQAPTFSDEEKIEHMRFTQVKSKKDFVHYERVDGKEINVVEGVELHTGIFDAKEQMKIVECVYKTYYEPKKWMGRKGRTIIQFGGCYNYAVDKNGNPPGIIRDEEVDPLPVLFKQMIKRMVRWHVLPPTCIPNSCIVNIYDEGDCIPPHIDHHDFIRPFCSVSFLSECNIVFGSSLKILNHGIGEFFGPVSVPLPVGSVLVLQGNGADVAKHCVPRVPSKRISITFRRMDESKLPYNYKPDPELMKIQPMVFNPPQFKEPSTP
ncbi:PREDICTED: RNA demethylase ALKBH5-like [Ipomoea nil]|uniref:RNA demethylase ALKBH5-like n=1 Tax=Ipomoea nil TaxID=35883 RepID=UPI000900B596|nr:PREDICTED: RNA demethylase ALKBH5-like [Ipomoea nil]